MSEKVGRQGQQEVKMRVEPTHRCKKCGALWVWYPPGVEPKGMWSLVSERCAPCCDNVAMGEQIERLRVSVAENYRATWFVYDTNQRALAKCWVEADAKRIAAALESSRPEAARDESGWVIERGDSQPHSPSYWTGARGGFDGWSQDHMEAVRFARKQDAERVSHGMRYPNNRIAEHAWAPAPAVSVRRV